MYDKKKYDLGERGKSAEAYPAPALFIFSIRDAQAFNAQKFAQDLKRLRDQQIKLRPEDSEWEYPDLRLFRLTEQQYQTWRKDLQGEIHRYGAEYAPGKFHSDRGIKEMIASFGMYEPTNANEFQQQLDTFISEHPVWVEGAVVAQAEEVLLQAQRGYGKER